MNRLQYCTSSWLQLCLKNLFQLQIINEVLVNVVMSRDSLYSPCNCKRFCRHNNFLTCALNKTAARNLRVVPPRLSTGVAGYTSSTSVTKVSSRSRETFFPLGCSAINSTSACFPSVVSSYIYKRAQFLSSAPLLLLNLFFPSSRPLFLLSPPRFLLCFSPFFLPRRLIESSPSQPSSELQRAECRVTRKNTRGARFTRRVVDSNRRNRTFLQRERSRPLAYLPSFPFR